MIAVSSEERDDEHGGYPAARVVMTPPEEVTNFEQTGDRLVFRRTQDYVDNTPPRSGQPTELFTHVSPQVVGAHSDPRMRHTIPTLIGLGMKTFGAEHDVPMADSALTQYSSRLSRKAAGRGLAVANPDNVEMVGDKYSNEISPRRQFDPIDDDDPYRVSESEVADARSWVRDRLRGPRNLGPQFTPEPEGEQLRLF